MFTPPPRNGVRHNGEPPDYRLAAESDGPLEEGYTHVCRNCHKHQKKNRFGAHRHRCPHPVAKANRVVRKTATASSSAGASGSANASGSAAATAAAGGALNAAARAAAAPTPATAAPAPASLASASGADSADLDPAAAPTSAASTVAPGVVPATFATGDDVSGSFHQGDVLLTTSEELSRALGASSSTPESPLVPRVLLEDGGGGFWGGDHSWGTGVGLGGGDHSWGGGGGGGGLENWGGDDHNSFWGGASSDGDVAEDELIGRKRQRLPPPEPRPEPPPPLMRVQMGGPPPTSAPVAAGVVAPVAAGPSLGPADVQKAFLALLPFITGGDAAAVERAKAVFGRRSGQ